mgnify:CR=1 FL=1
MDKETLIRLATPASIVVLASSIFSFPVITKANGGNQIGTPSNPMHIVCVHWRDGGYYYRNGGCYSG